MALSEQELRALREIEQSLLADDPKFGSAVSGVEHHGGGGFTFSLQAIAIFVLGLVVLIGGIALSQTNLWFVALSVVGFLLMFGAGLWMIRANDAKTPAIPRPATLGSRPGPSAPSSGGGFTDRMDERFRGRFDDRS
ncbi:DUF3040 domain-containing protein [Corynebacterium epidermidicanis]|uniref:Putative DUF3040 family protein n=1 Tax=Corynebacterium epidermidicanis TaxID=1050174 RepID=A0A0G3GQQ2_9CORY|nr:DUF3040 domain-containing protein [Corynebacterium epidermidicanis]AKK03531.1 putative DUF3040 family protein [Corynebacterium epidermidicanis]